MNASEILAKYRMYGPAVFWRFAVYEGWYTVSRQFCRRSYSQNGEDLLVFALSNRKRDGFYVDVGAYHPKRFSNTHGLYLRGWTGINIEPDPMNFSRFSRVRPRDLNLNIGIAGKNTAMTFYRFLPDTNSTFSESTAREYQQSGATLIGKKRIQVRTLASVLGNYSRNKSIDLLSIDAEGLDETVLRSNDWKKFRPRFLLVESHTHDMKMDGGVSVFRPTIYRYLRKQGYVLLMDNGTNSLYVDAATEVLV